VVRCHSCALSLSSLRLAQDLGRRFYVRHSIARRPPTTHLGATACPRSWTPLATSDFLRGKTSVGDRQRRVYWIKYQKYPNVSKSAISVQIVRGRCFLRGIEESLDPKKPLAQPRRCNRARYNHHTYGIGPS